MDTLSAILPFAAGLMLGGVIGGAIVVELAAREIARVRKCRDEDTPLGIGA